MWRNYWGTWSWKCGVFYCGVGTTGSDILYVCDVYTPRQKPVENSIITSVEKNIGALSTPQWSLCGSVINNFRSRDKQSTVSVYFMMLIN